MPTRVFTALDATTDEFTPSSNPTAVESGVEGGTTALLSTILTQTGVGSWEMNPNLNGTSPNGTATAKIIAEPFFGGDEALVQEWTVDYTNFPAIPETAHVKKLTFRRPRSVNYTIDGTFPSANVAGFSFYSDALATPIYFATESDSDFASPTLVVESITGGAADEVLFDLTGGDTFLTRQELIDNWSQFNNNLYGIAVTAEGDDAPNAAVASIVGSLVFGLGWTITVEYEEGLEYTLSQDSAPVDAGSVIRLFSPGGATGMDMEAIETINVTFPDPNNPAVTITIPVPEISWTVDGPDVLTFPLPALGGFEPPFLTIVITSSQFSGSVDAQTYTVFLISAPGIYKLVPGQAFDTLYNREGVEIDTTDVKIPNPFVRTGFING